MRPINRYLSTKIKASNIKATDENIQNIIKEEVNRLGVKADLNHIDVSQCTSLDSAFIHVTNFCGDVSKWNVSNVENMSELFSFCSDFNSYLNDWDVSKVKYMYRLFYGAHTFNQPLDKWDVSNVENMSCMFAYAESFNQDISNWNPEKITRRYQCRDMWSGKCIMQKSFKPKFKL